MMLIEDSTLMAHSKSSAVSPSPGIAGSGTGVPASANIFANPNALNGNSRYRQEVARRNLFDNAMKRMSEYLEKQKKSTER